MRSRSAVSNSDIAETDLLGVHRSRGDDEFEVTTTGENCGRESQQVCA